MTLRPRDAGTSHMNGRLERQCLWPALSSLLLVAGVLLVWPLLVAACRRRSSRRGSATSMLLPASSRYQLDRRCGKAGGSIRSMFCTSCVPAGARPAAEGGGLGFSLVLSSMGFSLSKIWARRRYATAAQIGAERCGPFAGIIRRAHGSWRTSSGNGQRPPRTRSGQCIRRIARRVARCRRPPARILAQLGEQWIGSADRRSTARRHATSEAVHLGREAVHHQQADRAAAPSCGRLRSTSGGRGRSRHGRAHRPVPGQPCWLGSHLVADLRRRALAGASGHSRSPAALTHQARRGSSPARSPRRGRHVQPMWRDSSSSVMPIAQRLRDRLAGVIAEQQQRRHCRSLLNTERRRVARAEELHRVAGKMRK